MSYGATPVLRISGNNITKDDKAILKKYGITHDGKYSEKTEGFLDQYTALSQWTSTTAPKKPDDFTKIREAIGEIAMRTIARAKSAAAAASTEIPNPFSIYTPVNVCEKNKRILEDITGLSHLGIVLDINTINCSGSQASNSSDSIESILNELYNILNSQKDIFTILNELYNIVNPPIEKILDELYELYEPHEIIIQHNLQFVQPQTTSVTVPLVAPLGASPGRGRGGPGRGGPGRGGPGRGGPSGTTP